MKALRFVVQVGLLALCLVPVGRRLAQDWGAVSTLATQLNAAAVVGAGLLLVLASLLLPVAMAAFTRGLSRRIGYGESAMAYYASQPMKYLPGGFWILPGRVMLLQRMGHDMAVASGGLLYEMAVQALAGALVGVVLVGMAGFTSANVTGGVWAALVGSLLACALLVASPALAQRLRRLPASIREAAVRLAAIPLANRLRNAAFTLAAFVTMWIMTGASFYLILVAGDPRLDLLLLKTAIGVSTLASLAGFLTPFSPGGIGVREAAIVLLLAGLVAAPEATLVAVLSRSLALIVEMAFALGAWLVWRSAHTPVTPADLGAALGRRPGMHAERASASGLPATGGKSADRQPDDRLSVVSHLVCKIPMNIVFGAVKSRPTDKGDDPLSLLSESPYL